MRLKASPALKGLRTYQFKSIKYRPITTLYLYRIQGHTLSTELYILYINVVMIYTLKKHYVYIV